MFYVYTLQVSKVWERSRRTKQQDTKQEHFFGRTGNSLADESFSCEGDYHLEWLDTSEQIQENEVGLDSMSAQDNCDVKSDSKQGTEKKSQKLVVQEGIQNCPNLLDQVIEEQDFMEQLTMEQNIAEQDLVEQDTQNLSKHQPQNYSKASSFTKSSFYPVTMELRPDTICDFLLAAEETSNGNFQSEKQFCLVGLHTCGDLCSTALRLFSEVHSARALCVVGCCYHHITEEDDANGEVYVCIVDILVGKAV